MAEKRLSFAAAIRTDANALSLCNIICPRSCITARFASVSSLARWLLSVSDMEFSWPEFPTLPQMCACHAFIREILERDSQGSRLKPQLGPNLPDCYLGAASEKELAQTSLRSWQICGWAVKIHSPAPINPSLGFWGFPQQLPKESNNVRTNQHFTTTGAFTRSKVSYINLQKEKHCALQENISLPEPAVRQGKDLVKKLLLRRQGEPSRPSIWASDVCSSCLDKSTEKGKRSVYFPWPLFQPLS